MKTTRSFHPGEDRYGLDWDACSTGKGFAQVDTRQDASYFGNWANPSTFRLVGYCEGDLTIQDCDDAQEFEKELRRWAALEHFGFKGIDPGLGNRIRDQFVDLGMTDLLHESCRPEADQALAHGSPAA